MGVGKAGVDQMGVGQIFQFAIIENFDPATFPIVQ